MYISIQVNLQSIIGVAHQILLWKKGKLQDILPAKIRDFLLRFLILSGFTVGVLIFRLRIMKDMLVMPP